MSVEDAGHGNSDPVGRIATAITLPIMIITNLWGLWFVIAAFAGWAVPVPGGQVVFQEPSILGGLLMLFVGMPVLEFALRLVSLALVGIVGFLYGLLRGANRGRGQEAEQFFGAAERLGLTETVSPRTLRRVYRRWRSASRLGVPAEPYLRVLMSAGGARTQGTAEGRPLDPAHAGATVSAGNDAALSLNRDSLVALLRDLYGKTREGLDNLDAISALAGELLEAGYSTLDEVRRDLNAGSDAALAYESTHPPNKTLGARFSAVGFARQALALANKRYSDLKYPNDSSLDSYRGLAGG